MKPITPSRSRSPNRRYQTAAQIKRVAEKLGPKVLFSGRTREQYESLLYKLLKLSETPEAKKAVLLRIQALTDRTLKGRSENKIRAMFKKAKTKKQATQVTITQKMVEQLGRKALLKLRLQIQLKKGSFDEAKKVIRTFEKEAKGTMELLAVSKAWMELADTIHKHPSIQNREKEEESCWKEALKVAKRTEKAEFTEMVRVGARLRGIRIE